METKHTKGRWVLMEFGDYNDFDGRSQVIMSEDLSGDDPFRIAVVHVVHVSDEEGAANARLIAASPQLLDALEELHAASLDNDQERMYQARADAREIIALATGSEVAE
jgi:hypothetical protein